MSNDEKKFDEWRKEQAKKRITKPGNGHPRLSKAPPPITPAAGFKAYGVTTRITPPAKTPDWDFWLNMPEVKLWQAVALSMNIDPDSLKHSGTAWMAEPGGGPIFTNDSFSSSEQQIIFDKRLRLLVANKSVKNGFSPGTLSMDDPAYHSVRQSEFSPWAQSIGWDIPAELAAMARKHGEQAGAPAAQNDAPVTPAKVSPGDTADDEETPAERRAKIDITTLRGCPRLIVENWGSVENLHGPNADGRQVRRILERNLGRNEKAPSLKTVQNQLRNLRLKKLIP